MHDVCDDCLAKFKAAEPWYKDHPCDWCHSSTENIRPTRDTDEGSSGPVYYVCRPCRAKQNAEDREELEWMHRNDDYGEEG